MSILKTLPSPKIGNPIQLDNSDRKPLKIVSRMQAEKSDSKTDIVKYLTYRDSGLVNGSR